MKLRDIAKIITTPYGNDPSAKIYFNVDDENVLAIQNVTYQNIIRGCIDVRKILSQPDDNLNSTKLQKLYELLDYNVLNIQPCDGECGERGSIDINLTTLEISPVNYMAEI